MRKYRKASPLGIGTVVTVVFIIFDLPGKVNNYTVWKCWLGHIDITPLITWAPVLLGACISLYFWRQESLVAKENFDMTIEQAIRHVASGDAYRSYEQKSDAYMEAFRDIYVEIRNGNMSIRGRAGQQKTPRQISDKQCKKLIPVEVITPNGIVFAIADNDSELHYMGLRLDSRELYKIWPKGQDFS